MFFDAIHGDIGVLEQGFGILAIIGEDGDADADADEKLVIADFKRFGKYVDDFLRDLAGIMLIRQVIEDDDEFVAAVAGNGILDRKSVV